MHHITNILTPDDIKQINEGLKDIDPKPQEIYGRTMYHGFILPDNAKESIMALMHQYDANMSYNGATVVEYSNEYGEPNLPPHFDGDPTDWIIDYQLESNTDWTLGHNTDYITLKDNEAMLFDPNETIHWRAHKEFKDGEFIRMIFFRFYNKDNKVDHPEKRYSQDNPIFDDAKAVRDSL